MSPKFEKRGLGRGLSALMADVNLRDEDSGQARAETTLPIEALKPNPLQPRRDFKDSDLQSLAESIRQKGVLQPLIVRPAAIRDTYEIVAGERRWRAAQIAQLHQLPVIVRNFSDSEVLEVAIIENIQRADLNAIEEALGYRQLMDRFGHTQEKVSEALGKSRSHVANLLRLLALPEEVQSMVRAGTLSAGHARALISHPEAIDLAKKIVGKGLSVRETERLVRKIRQAGPRTRGVPEKDADTRAIEADLSANIRMPVRITHEATGGGALSISYRTLEDLDRLCRILSIDMGDASQDNF